MLGRKIRHSYIFKRFISYKIPWSDLTTEAEIKRIIGFINSKKPSE
jgi:hypothetical protein